MSSFHFVKSSLSPLPTSKFSLCNSGHGLLCNSFRIKKLNLCRRLPNTYYYCKVGENENQNQNQSNGEEAPESLFMKELRRRGISPTTSLLEETKSDQVEGSSQSRDDPIMPQSALLNQREQSMALNSEGLEGLIPRAKRLLTLGGTFFLSFGPLILLTIAFFLVLYLYFGPSFVHGGNDSHTTIPQYIDPYQLLEEERITASELKL